MATKTIVCPECQAPAAPGRYACAQCGALLASVGLTPRASSRAEPDAGAAIPPSAASAEPEPNEVPASPTTTLLDARTAIPVAPAWTQSLAPEPADSEPNEDERWDDELPAVDPVGLDASTVAPNAEIDVGSRGRLKTPAPEQPVPIAVADALASLAPVPAPTAHAVPEVPAVAQSSVAAAVAVPEPKRRAPRIRRANDPAAIDRIAPLAAPVVQPEWPVAQPEPDAETAFAARAALAARAGVPFAVAPIADPVPETTIEVAESAALESPAAIPGWADDRPAEPAEARTPPPAVDDPIATQQVDARAVPGWPPPGTVPLAPEPAPRVPAGSYLPPSAVLPPGEALPAVAARNGRAHGPSGPSDDALTGPARAAAAARLADLGLPADTPRRIVSIGAAVAAMGFLLPWSAGILGNDLLGDYWARWGLAGPGHWIVAALLVALAVLALAGGRLATVSVGLPAVAGAALLLGLAWPYLFGFGGRAVGLWVVLAGLLLLVAGGLLEIRSDRHHEPTSAV